MPTVDESKQGGVPLWVLLGLSVLVGAGLCAVLVAVNPFPPLQDLLVKQTKEQLLGAVLPQARAILDQLINQLAAPSLHVARSYWTTLGLWVALLCGCLLPWAASAFTALVGHGLMKLCGGTPGGWRATWRIVAWHRLGVDFATLVLVGLVVALGKPLVGLSLLLAFGLLLIRFTGLVAVLVAFSRAHRFGVLRTVFLGVPCAVLALVASFFVVAVQVGWVVSWMVVKAVS